ncbi:hypothetical protein E2C01_012950 [Portunus trituberculatus]|uniref:Uncharacterized protein n=1 Tax=Portunus trituberculatus TaxID=210409 RepID=A0A5B7DF77_PORTR|nr:hypothetical protein [Portunus trituberculatus]
METSALEKQGIYLQRDREKGITGEPIFVTNVNYKSTLIEVFERLATRGESFFVSIQSTVENDLRER